MNPRVTDVHAVDDHTLMVAFTNGEARRFDMRPYFSYPAFAPLRQPAVFRSVRVVHGTASWPGGIDLDPDTLFADGIPANTPARQVTA